PATTPSCNHARSWHRCRNSGSEDPPSVMKKLTAELTARDLLRPETGQTGAPVPDNGRRRSGPASDYVCQSHGRLFESLPASKLRYDRQEHREIAQQIMTSSVRQQVKGMRPNGIEVRHG